MIKKLLVFVGFLVFCTNVQAQYTTLESYSGVHPRLLADAATFTNLNTLIQSENGYEQLWDVLKPIADNISGNPPTDKLWRARGWELATLVAAYTYSGDVAYFNKAITIANTAITLSDWIVDSDNSDLAMGHISYGMAMLYDWCYDDLSTVQRQQIHDVLLFNIEKNVALLDDNLDPKIFWEDDYLGNHLYINILGMVSGAVAIFDYSEDTKTRVFAVIDQCIPEMDIAFQSLADDGANIEGMSYFGYGMENLLMYVEVSNKFFDTDIYDTSEHLKNVNQYLTHMHLPRSRWQTTGMHTVFADNVGYSYGGTNFIARKLASAYGDTQMQWLAEEVDKIGNNDTDVTWLNILWQDGAVASADDADKSTYHYFDDVEIVSSRSGWSGDESLFVFKCGPFLGHKAMALRNSIDTGSDWGGAHAHPDANHFSIYSKEWLLEDDGYSWKYTSNHNTLSININGAYVGQYGERAYFTDHGATPPANATPEILKAETSSKYDYTVGDASMAYNSAFIEKFQRHLVYVKEQNVVLVVDDIKQGGENTRNTELRFFTTPQMGEIQADGGYLFEGTNTTLKLSSPLGGSIVPTVAKVAKYDRNNATDDRLCIRYNNTANAWKNAVAFSWSDKTKTPPDITIKDEGNGTYSFKVKNEIYILNSVDQSVTVMLDDDSDGIFNDDDLCPGTPENAVVDIDGCEVFSLPATNFKLLTTSESCMSSNNGSINIEAEEALNYTVEISGGATLTKTFTDVTEFTDLSSGTYKVCITVEGQTDYENCFSLVIGEPEPLSVTSKIDSDRKSVSLKLSGGLSYTIAVNDETFTTSANEIAIPLSNVENTITVQTDKDCQGVHHETIVLNSKTLMYPNPVSDTDLTLLLGNLDVKTVAVVIYTIDGQQVYTKACEVTGDKLTLNIDSLANGTYLLHAKAKNTLLTYKLIVE